MRISDWSSDVCSSDLETTWIECIEDVVLAEVRVTCVRWDDGLRWCVVTFAVDPRGPARRREVPVPEGRDHHDIATLLRNAFPDARWDIAQDYDVTFGVLTEHITLVPGALLGGDAP